MFDKRFDDDFEADFDAEEGPTHLQQIRRILDESKINFEEDSDKDYDTIFILDNGVRFLFDDEGLMLGTEVNYDKKD